MPRRANPYYADQSWANAANNLTEIIAGNPVQNAELEQALTAARSQQQQDRFERLNRKAREAAAQDYELGNALGGMSDLLRAGNTGDLGPVNQAFGGEYLAQGNATPDQQFARMSGAGNTPGPDEALTTGRQDAISARNAAESQRETFGEQRLENQGEMSRLQFEETQGRFDDPAERIANSPGFDQTTWMGQRYGNTDPSTGDPIPSDLEQALIFGQQPGGMTVDEYATLRWGPDDMGGDGAGGGDGGLTPAQLRLYEEAADEALNAAIGDMGYNLDEVSVPLRDRRAIQQYVTREAQRRPNVGPRALANEAIQALDFQEEMTQDNWTFNDYGPVAQNRGVLEPSAGGAGGSGGQTPAADGIGSITLRDPESGQTFDTTDVQETARNHKMTPQQVVDHLKQRGFEVR